MSINHGITKSGVHWKRVYRIESRWHKWSRWETVTATICASERHGERLPFNENRQLEFDNIEEAQIVMEQMAKANAGEYRIVPVTITFRQD